MSNYLKTESDYVNNRKESNLSLTSNKSTNSLSNSKSQVLFKNNFFPNMKNVNFNNFSFIKNFNLPNSNNKTNYHPSLSALSTLSNPLEVQKQNNINITSSSNIKRRDSNKKKIILSDIDFQHLINRIKCIFNKIKKYLIDNYPCHNECNLWIKVFTPIYDYIIEKNSNNEYFNLIKYTLMLMGFSMIILYDINIQNKQKFFSDEMKKILNIHALMSESIYGNSLNDPQINAKDESNVIILSCKDMNNRLLKILKQYNKVNEKKMDKLIKYFNTLKNESYDNIYKFYLNEIENQNSIQNEIQNENKNYNNNTQNSNSNYHQKENNNNNIRYNIDTNKTEKSLNKKAIKSPYQTYTESLSNNNLKNNQKTQSQIYKKKQIVKNNNIGTINGTSTFLDNSNNVFLLQKPIESSIPIKQKNEELNKKTPFLKNNLSQNYSNIDNSFYKNIIHNSQNLNYQQYIHQQRLYTEENLSNNNNKKILLTPQLTPKEINNGFNINTSNNNNYNKSYSNTTTNTTISNNYNKHYSNTTYNTTISNKYKQNLYINKTPIRGSNIGNLNIITFKNLSLTPDKNLYNKNSTLIPFPPLKPYTLVLDLDQTLVHVPKNCSSIILRPGLRNFLHSLLPYYELIVFTTGVKEYADQIINFIEMEEKYFSYRLYRQNATFLNENYCKDLNKLGRDLKKIIIVDDKAINIKLQQDNGIIIKPFLVENYNNDFILFDLIRVLIRIAKDKPDDVRERLKFYKDEINNKISNN